MSPSTAQKASSPIVTLHLSNVVRPQAGLRLAISNGRSKLALLGPAFVVAIGYIDPGNYATNIQAGAEYGYLLLWVVLWGNLMAAHIQFAGANSLYLAAGILGATVMPHVIYLHSALSRADADSNGALTPRSLFRASRWDVAIAMTTAGFVNLAMLAMAAAVFHRPHGVSVGDIAVAYKTMEPILGPVAMHMFGASLIVAGVSSTVVGTLAGQEVMQGFVRFHIPLWLRRVLTMAPSFAVILLGFNVTDVLVLSQVILSFGITLAIVPLVIFTSRRSIMGELVNSRLVTLTSWLIVGLVVALNVFLLSAIRG